MKTVVKIQNGIARHPSYRLKNPVNLNINDNECIAIIGENGSGKSMLVDIITEKHPLLDCPVEYDFSPSAFKNNYDNIKHIAFLDAYGTNDGMFYYQQRWNQTEIDSYPTVKSLLNDELKILENRLNSDKHLSDDDRNNIMKDRDRAFQKLYQLFGIDTIENKKIVMLSSGEQRKFQLIKSMMSNPRLLVIDNPFLGLDRESRKQLYNFLELLVNETNTLLILVISKTNEVPMFVTHVYETHDMNVSRKYKKSEWCSLKHNVPNKVIDASTEQKILDLPYSFDKNLERKITDYPIIDFKDLTIKYGNRTILQDINFTVRNCEHWALCGKNGSGKSTLLSIIFADNPQAYSNDIYLFGRKRGTGESIWDIKKNIGYVSPEMHRAYLKNIKSISIVASGLRDTIGLYLKPKQEQMDICHFWLSVFGMEKYADTDFMNLSSGEQRLVLLARAFVKDPYLLILDEPLHGLDNKNRQLVKDVINVFLKRHNKTLIMVSHYDEDFPEIIDHKLVLKVK